MTLTDHHAMARPLGALLSAAIAFMIAGAAIAVPAGLTLNPDDTAGTLAAVDDRVGLHLLELGLDVIGWLALACAGLVMAVIAAAAGRFTGLVAAGLLALAGAAGLLHDAGNLAVTQLAGGPAEPSVAAAEAVLLTAKWTVNLAGLLWVAATVASAAAQAKRLRWAGAAAAVSGLAAVAVPWTAGTSGPSPELEQVGYLLHLPVMAWWAVLGWRHLRPGPPAAS
ncbi:hypothetical protein [Glycomyces harbinensis]|uniref:DUF4386 family protein n=1 Tax=Glycomyces harbinensis TaxID=58114 RepID=A0A1G7AG56_9ACTN|nr:hypothetical protein [Glycomyces harbinensis]SDE13025.1 hypothetical protein SAMN05216270_11387 [Glycomyces harbinensis]